VDITRNSWFRGVTSIASVLGVYALLIKVGLLGAGHYSVGGFFVYALAALGLERLLRGLLGMAWVILAPTDKLVAGSRN
jgi:hypothetical protein